MINQSLLPFIKNNIRSIKWHIWTSNTITIIKQFKHAKVVRVQKQGKDPSPYRSIWLTSHLGIPKKSSSYWTVLLTSHSGKKVRNYRL